MKNVIIIPTYNERKNITPLIEDIFSVVPDVFVMVVDDSSPDGTYEVVRELMRKFPRLSLLLREKKEGLRKAYVHALQEVLRDDAVTTLTMMDADLSHNPKYLPQLLAAAKHADVVIGSRYIAGGDTEGWELWRRMLSKYGNIYARLVTGLPVRDCTSGFCLMRADALRRIDLNAITMSGYAFLMELKYLLWRSGVRIAEVPITFHNRLAGRSKMSGHIIKEGLVAPWKIRAKK